MNFRKIISLIMCALMLVSVLMLAACSGEGGSGGGSKCEHEWGEWTYLKAPTCSKAGEETRTCLKCSGIQIREAAVAPHDYVVGEWSWNSTKEIAYVLLTCKNDRLHRKVEKGEVKVTVKTAPTCGASGVNIHIATYVFNEVTYSDSVEVSVPATGNHNYVNGKCSGCGASK